MRVIVDAKIRLPIRKSTHRTAYFLRSLGSSNILSIYVFLLRTPEPQSAFLDGGRSQKIPESLLERD